MDTSKVIKGVVNSGRYTVTAPIVKEDYGLYLQIEGVELPSTYEVDFSNDEHHGTSVTMIGNADGVLIPHQFIDTGKDIFAFLYHVGEDYGRTVYKFRIPNKVRPDRTNEQPTPEEQSVIDQAISALNSAVAQTAQDVIDADASAQSASEDAERAEEARTDAQNYATQAEQSATDAQTIASQASASATASAQSASQSAQIKSDIEGMVDDAQGYAQASAQSATASANSATTAQGYANTASASAQSASTSASDALTYANTASSKASEASTSAQTASTKASEATQSATNASQSAQTAESAKTASQTAQGLAESARDSAISAKNDAEQAKADAESARDAVQSSAAQITTNAEDITQLKEGLNNSIIPSAWISDKFVNHTNGREYDSTAYKHTGKIFIGGANFVFIRAKVAGNAGYAFYTDTKEYISGGQTSESAITKITVPSNAVYIDVSNNASYNTPVINLDSYGRTVSSGFKTELIGNYSDGTITINTGEYTSGYIAKYSDRDTITIVDSTAYLHSGLVPIIGGQKILVHNVTPAYGYALHFLDSSQKWVGGVTNTNTGQEQADVYAETPINAVYMMFNKLASSSTTQSAEYLVGVKNGVIADTLVPSWYERSRQKMTTLYGNATKKLIATIVDDDTMTATDVLRFKSYLDQAGIKGTLATLTFNWTRDTNLENTLLSMEREGYQVVLHAFSQISDFEHPTTDAQFEACEDNFIRGLRDVKMAGFCNPDFWVTPYGSDEERLQRMAKRCGLKALVSTHNTYNGTDGGKGRYNLNRCAFAESDGAGSITDAQLKSIAAEAAANDGWLILMTHFATWGDSTAEVTRFNDMINYIKGLGFEFMTLGEAWEIRKPIYEINDMF